MLKKYASAFLYFYYSLASWLKKYASAPSSPTTKLITDLQGKCHVVFCVQDKHLYPFSFCAKRVNLKSGDNHAARKQWTPTVRATSR